jgi:DNA-binding PadR family transcriptional regulator
MQRLIKTWGKDEVVNVGRRANLYKTIDRLREAGLIAVRQTERSSRYPERTVYELTEEGRATARRWLLDMLAEPHDEYPRFPAALSFAMVLTPEELAEALARRLEASRARLERLRGQLKQHRATQQPIVMVETDYQVEIARAEVRWLTRTLADLESGELSWDLDELARQADDSATRAIDQ